MWPPSSVRRSGFAQSWGVLPARVLGTEHRGGRLSTQSGTGSRRQGGTTPSAGISPGETLMLKRVVAIFDATQKVRKSPGTLVGDGNLGHLEGMTAWGHGLAYR